MATVVDPKFWNGEWKGRGWCMVGLCSLSRKIFEILCRNSNFCAKFLLD